MNAALFGVMYGVSALALLFLCILALRPFLGLSRVKKSTVILSVFFAGWCLNFASGFSSDSSPTENYRLVLSSAYSALVMFLGEGAISTFENVAAPVNFSHGAWGVFLHSALFFTHVLAILLTITSIVSLASSEFSTWVRVKLARPKVIIGVKGLSKDAAEIARVIAKDSIKLGSRRTLISVIPEDEVDETTHQTLVALGIPVLHSENLLIDKAGKTTKLNLIHIDHGQPEFIESLKVLNSSLKHQNPSPYRVAALATSREVKDEVLKQRVDFDLNVQTSTELIARDAIKNNPPYRLLKFHQGVPKRPYSVLLVSEPGSLQEQTIQQLVLHSQFLGELPNITVLPGADFHDGSFWSRHPELSLSANIEFSSISTHSREFYELLATREFDQVMIVRSDFHSAFKTANNVVSFYRSHTENEQPAVALYSRSLRKDTQEITFFGAVDSVYSYDSLIRETQDERARMVNAFYEGLVDVAPTDDIVRKSWDKLEYIHRVSSRSSADFVEAMLWLKHDLSTLHPVDATDILAQTEHLRWNAFYRSLGYRRMSVERLEERFAHAVSAGNSRPGKWARDDTVALQHICIVPWNELPLVSETYSALTAERIDFQETDRDVLRLINHVQSLETGQ